MFPTALVPNLPAIELTDETAKVLFTGMDWFTAFAPIGLVLLALGLWFFGGDFINATTVAIGVIALMVIGKVVSWDDILANKPAWNTLVWFATLVALADGLNRVGFVKWFADTVGAQMTGFSPTVAMLLVAVFFFTHYLFASITAHVTAMLPVMLAVGMGIPGTGIRDFAPLLALTLGLMGILAPYATGPSPVYYGFGTTASATSRPGTTGGWARSSA